MLIKCCNYYSISQVSQLSHPVINKIQIYNQEINPQTRMSSHFTHLFFKVLILTLYVNLITCAVTWSDLPDIRMGQKSIYDSVYIPINSFTFVDLTYKTPFLTAAPFSNQAVVISGFQNYLHFQININVTISNTYQDKVVLSIWAGSQTYLKQLRVNFIVIQTGGTADGSIGISIGNYRTLDLDELGGPRSQVFTNQTYSFPAAIAVCSAIHGIDYYNTNGTVNQVNVDTQFVNLNPGGTIKQTVVVGEKGRLNYISITTIVISSNFYPNPNMYLQLGYTFETNIPSTGWSTVFNAMSNGGLLTSTDNSIFFGIRGFNFTMQGSRLFLLDIATQTDFTNNLHTNSYMKYAQLSFLLLANRVCPTPTDFYWVQGFQCVPACLGLLQDTPNLICMTCQSVCDGCTNTKGNCNQCKVGNNRVKNTSVTPINCVCDFNAGYVQVLKQDKCQLCSDLISGCVLCSTPTSCDYCGDPTLYQQQPTPTGFKCGCTNSKYLVTGVCLSYQGCIRANKYVTGEFCQQCDTLHNFQKNLTNNSSCKCMTAYFINSSTGYCVDICGDSRTPASPLNVSQAQFICDDGNTQSGDGCSSSCRQQYGYRCQIDIVGGISKCAVKQQVKIEYLYTQKNLIANQATVVFMLLPQQHLLTQNAFQNAVKHNIPQPVTTKIKFDPKNSLIMITIDYAENLQSNPYQFNFTFTGMNIYYKDIPTTNNLYGRNAKLQIGKSHQQVNIITYVALAVSALALLVALIAGILGEKMMGIQLILPAQAAFFCMATFPKNVLSPVSALWSLKYSNGYNSLGSYDMATNYMLDSRVNIMQYSGQYIMNYNIMFIPLALIVIIVGIIAVRIAWLQRQEKRLQDLQRKKEEEDRDEKQTKKKTHSKEKKSSSQKTDEQQTQKQTEKGGNEQTLEKIEDELQDARENIKNWKNFMYMIFDRFFTIFIVTAIMKVVFCFYIQLSNLTYTAEVYDNSLNAGFFFISYATVITGLYAIVYDYKTDKLVLFTCNKGKYAMFYISIFLAFIILLGAIYESSYSVYVVAVFAIMPLVLIPYQVPYGFGFIGFQNIIALICQLPFVITMAVSLILTFQKNNMQQSTSMIFAYAIIGSIGLSIILTIVRLIKFIDCSKISFIQFTDRKKQNSNDKNKKKNKVVLLQLDADKNWDQDSQDSVRAILHERKKQEESDIFNIDEKNKEGYEAIAQKNQPKPLEKQKLLQEDEDDQEIDELQKIKLKLRKELKQKKVLGKIK